jgi:hypothetical protein
LLAAHTIRIHARLPPPRYKRSPRVSGPAPAISSGLAAAFALGSFATTAMVVNGVHMLADRSVSLDAASLVFALLAPLQVLGRFWFLRRRGLLRHDHSIPFLLVGAGVIALIAAPRLPSLALFIVLFGSGAGVLTTMRAAIVVSHVHAEHVAKHLGAYAFVTSIARALAPALSSVFYLAVGFEVTLLTVATMMLIASLLVCRATDRARTRPVHVVTVDAVGGR